MFLLLVKKILLKELLIKKLQTTPYKINCFLLTYENPRRLSLSVIIY